MWNQTAQAHKNHLLYNAGISKLSIMKYYVNWMNWLSMIDYQFQYESNQLYKCEVRLCRRIKRQERTKSNNLLSIIISYHREITKHCHYIQHWYKVRTWMARYIPFFVIGPMSRVSKFVSAEPGRKRLSAAIVSILR